MQAATLHIKHYIILNCIYIKHYKIRNIICKVSVYYVVLYMQSILSIPYCVLLYMQSVHHGPQNLGPRHALVRNLHARGRLRDHSRGSGTRRRGWARGFVGGTEFPKVPVGPERS